ncbi:phosphonate degradation HD-domain oxygenase [Chitinivorax sp. PXF-14]|uniref:phosphonate degradation HD-domain oxygenase n=1 Tax=Chitinivorax sp. PXF-14 TaxID=3230488 RepID=UPI00346685F0
MNPNVIESLDALSALYLGQGQSRYGGEAVSQLAHALQSAHAAEASGAAPSLIVAALLHDVGHLVAGQGNHDVANGIDDHHEAVGVNALRALFGDEVLQPIALHVAAKRYLCALHPDYLALLSDASRQSLALQGGPMTADEAARFSLRPYAAEAIGLRHCDDAAKAVDAITPPFEHYLAMAATLLKPAQ